MLGKYKLKHPEELKCGNNQKIEMMCLNPACQEPSLICRGYDCPRCEGEDGELHLECSKIELKAVTSKLNKRVDKQKSFIARTCEIEEQFIRQLQKSREPLTQKYGYGNLDESHHLVIQRIYDEKNSQFLKGNEAKEFWKRVKDFKAAGNDSLFTSLLHTYEEAFRKLIEEAIQLKEKIYSAFSEEKEVKEGLSCKIGSKEKFKEDFDSCKIDSLILNGPLSSSD